MTALKSYVFTSVEDVKETLGIPSSNSQSDNLIVRKINAATDMIENFLGRRIIQTTYTNIEYDPTNSDQLILQQRPITELISFEIRGSDLNENDWETIDSTLYFVDRAAGVIDLSFTTSGRWNSYRVSYTAGYVTVPSDLAEACATLAAFLVLNPTGNVAQIRSKQEGQRQTDYYDSTASSGGSADTALFRQIGIYSTIIAYANNPVLADK